MNKKYTLVTSNRQAKPRSKRLRELGGGTSGSAGATVVNVSSNQGVAKDPNSHTHANRADLDKFGTDTDGYAYITQMQEVEEIDENGNRKTNWKDVRNKAKAGYADSAAVAHDLTEDSPIRSQFLSKVAADVAAGRITFLEGIEVVKAAALRGGLSIGEYLQGATGAAIDTAGNVEVESITVRSYLKVFELIYNRLNALEGNTSFADVGTIDSVNGQILTMRKRWEGDFTAFQPGDIVYGYVNDLHNAEGGGYYKAWAWVRSVDRENNALQVASYPGTEVPGGHNYPLRAGMVITRWGNNIEANTITWANPEYNAVIEKRDNGYFNTRQSSFFISCEDGNLVELMGVNKPILEPSNYGTVLGKIPEGLLSTETAKLINKDQPYLYARGIIVQDLIRIDYDGAVTRMSNYRGTWSAETAASETEYYRSTTGAYDTVTWNNCLWQCVASGTTDEPSEATGSWVNMSGGVEIPELRVWKIMPNTDIVTLRYNANSQTVITPEKVSCAVLLTSTEGTVTYNSSLDLNTDHGVKLYYSLDGTAWKEFVIGNTEPLETEYSEAFEAEASTADNPIYLVLGGDDVAATEIGDRIYFELRSATDVLARSVIPVVKDGYEGKDGQLVYPAGNYSASAVYTATGDTSPVVMYESNYYMLLRGKTYQGEQMPENRQNPAADVANGGDDVRWRLFDKFNAVFADVLMAAFAKLGGAVFYGDYMISQNGTIYGSEVQGVDKNGVAYYRQFTDGVTYGTFIPNLMLNFLTGEVRAMKGILKGTIEAEGGKIGGFQINEDSISSGDVSNNDFNEEGKAIISPRRFFIQDIDPDYKSSYYRVAFGRKSDPSNTSEYGCMGYIHKYDKSSDYYKAFYPTLRIIANSIWGYTIGIMSKGAIVTDEGAIAENGHIVDIDTHAVTAERMQSTTGTLWCIKNKIANDEIVFLPSVIDIQRVLNNYDRPFIWKVKFTVKPTSYRVRISTLDNVTDSPVMFNGTTSISNFTAQPGKFYEAWLINDGEDMYWQIREI